MKLVCARLLLLSAIAATGCAPVPATSRPPAAPPPAAPSAEVSVQPAPTAALAATGSAYRLAQAASRQVVVKLDDLAALDAAIARGWVRLVRALPTMEAALVEVSGPDVDGAIARLAALPGIRHAEREGIAVVGAGFGGFGGRTTRPPARAAAPVAPAGGSVPLLSASSPNDPRFSAQWALGTITAVSAWGAGVLAAATPVEPVIIAILDTGVDQNHEDLDPAHTQDDQRGKLLRDINFTASDTVDDVYGHGTHVAGIAAAVANNGVGVAGTFPDAKLMNVKVIGDNGIGYDSAIASGIRWAADHGAQVLNCSFGQTTDATLVREAVAYAVGKGVLVVGAAGNEGKDIKRYPAAYPAAIAVAATTQGTRTQPEGRATFSNFGAEWVDVAAPGDAILSTFPNHTNTIGVQGYGTMNGTSMATPMVSAEAAMLWHANGGDANRVRARIEGKSDARVAGTGTSWAKGRINCYRALMEP